MKVDAQLKPEQHLFIWQDSLEMQRFRQKLDIQPSSLREPEIAVPINFLQAQEDRSSLRGTYCVTDAVPSGLSIDC